MKDHKPYPLSDEENDNVLTAQEPVAAYVSEPMAMPEELPYAHTVNGVLQVTADIDEEIAAADRGETVSLNEFKSLFARWIDK